MAMRPSLPVPSLSRRAKIIIGVVVLLVLALSVLGSLVRLYVDWLWFGEVGFRQVFSTNLRHPDPVVRPVRPADGRGDRGQPGGGVPVPPAVPADVARAAESRALPLRAGAAPEAHRRAGRRRARRLHRHHRPGAVGDLAAVAQRHPVRHPGPAVQDRHRLLRVHLPVPALRAGPAVHRGGALAAVGAGRALPVRRGAAADAGGEGHAGRAGPPVRAARHLRAAQGGGLLPRPVRVAVQRAGRAHRRGVHGRQRGAPGQDDPDVRRADLRGGGLRQHLPAQRAAAGDRAGAAGAHLGAGQRDLPGDRAAVHRPAEREREGSRVHRAQHHGDPRGVRDQGRERGRQGQPRPSTTPPPTSPRRCRRWRPTRRRSRTPGCSTRTC